MAGILINYKNINDGMPIYTKLSKPSRESGVNIGIIMIIDTDTLKDLENIKDNERLKYVGSNLFPSKVRYHCFIYFNQKICLLTLECEKYLPIVLNLLNRHLSQKLILWINLGFENKNTIKSFVKHGFHSPYITEKTPFGVKISHSIALCRNNTVYDGECEFPTFQEINYLIEQYNNGHPSCNVYAKLSKQAYHSLINLCKTKQKEISGELYPEDIIKYNGKTIFVIGLNNNSLFSGEDEKVIVQPTRYSFHSHPQVAYERHNIEKAWPSVYDYLACVKLGDKCIFHCVVTLEGIYVITVNHNHKLSIDDIEREYDISHHIDMTPEEYVYKVNKISPYFKVFFLTSPGYFFKVYYQKTGLSCIATQKIIEKYKKLNE